MEFIVFVIVLVYFLILFGFMGDFVFFLLILFFMISKEMIVDIKAVKLKFD